MVRMGNKRELVHADISEVIIRCCFEVMKELGPGFLETVYKNALFIAMKESGLTVLVEQSFEVFFRNRKIGKYIADLIVENLIVVELKCCKTLLSEHQAQVINYLYISEFKNWSINGSIIQINLLRWGNLKKNLPHLTVLTKKIKIHHPDHPNILLFFLI